MAYLLYIEQGSRVEWPDCSIKGTVERPKQPNCSRSAAQTADWYTSATSITHQNQPHSWNNVVSASSHAPPLDRVNIDALIDPILARCQLQCCIQVCTDSCVDRSHLDTIQVSAQREVQDILELQKSGLSSYGHQADLSNQDSTRDNQDTLTGPKRETDDYQSGHCD